MLLSRTNMPIQKETSGIENENTEEQQNRRKSGRMKSGWDRLRQGWEEKEGYSGAANSSDWLITTNLEQRED